MPTDPTAADRMRRWRERQQAGTSWQPLVCTSCPRNNSGKHGSLCCRCWERLTPEGREVRAKRLRESRARRRQRDNL